MRIRVPTYYGESVVEIGGARVSPMDTGLVDLFDKRVTIYNDIAAGAVEPRHFDRFVIPECNVQGGYVNKADGTIQNLVNAVTVITKAVASYLPPLEYVKLPVDLRAQYFTASVGDFIVFDEVEDVVTTAAEFAALKRKYANDGMQVVSVTANVNGMAVDNVQMANV